MGTKGQGKRESDSLQERACCLQKSIFHALFFILTGDLDKKKKTFVLPEAGGGGGGGGI